MKKLLLRDLRVENQHTKYKKNLFKHFNNTDIYATLFLGKKSKFCLFSSSSLTVHCNLNEFDNEAFDLIQFIKKLNNCQFSRITLAIDSPLLNEILEIMNPHLKMELLNHPSYSKRPNSNSLNYITIDSVHENLNTTVIIPHWNSPDFLRLCLHSLRKFFPVTSEVKILVIDDDSDKKDLNEITSLRSAYNFEIISVKRLDKETNANVGYLLDYAVYHINSDIVFTIDCDLIVLSPQFLEFPSKLLKSGDYISVGNDTGLSLSYVSKNFRKRLNLHKIKSSTDSESYSFTNNLYRAMLKNDYIATVENVGFARNYNKIKWVDRIGSSLRYYSAKFFLENKLFLLHELIVSLSNSKFLNSNHPLLPPTSDNGVNANYWMSIHSLGKKYILPINSYGLRTPNDGVVFQRICDLAVHIALSTRALSNSRREVNAGRAYEELISKLMDYISNDIELALKFISEESKKYIF